MDSARRRNISALLASIAFPFITDWQTSAHAQSIPADLDVPFVVTPDNVVLRMLEMAQVAASDTVLDLGSGDGRIVITAALRYGAMARGVEIDPNLVEQARAFAARAGVTARAQFEIRDLFETDLSRASVITLYLLPDVNIALRPKLLGLRPGVRLVSHDWDMGDWLPEAQVVIDAPEKRLGLKKVAKLMLWVVPAQLHGRHTGTDIELQVVQNYQRIESARLRIGKESLTFASATVRGPSVTLFGEDLLGRSWVLEANITQPHAELMYIQWQLRRSGAPDRTFSTQRASQ
jgi:SAM-dependent methyltransferase